MSNKKPKKTKNQYDVRIGPKQPKRNIEQMDLDTLDELLGRRGKKPKG